MKITLTLIAYFVITSVASAQNHKKYCESYPDVLKERSKGAKHANEMK